MELELDLKGSWKKREPRPNCTGCLSCICTWVHCFCIAVTKIPDINSWQEKKVLLAQCFRELGRPWWSGPRGGRAGDQSKGRVIIIRGLLLRDPFLPDRDYFLKVLQNRHPGHKCSKGEAVGDSSDSHHVSQYTFLFLWFTTWMTSLYKLLSELHLVFVFSCKHYFPDKPVEWYFSIEK